MEQSVLLETVLGFIRARTTYETFGKRLPAEERLTYANIAAATGIKESWIKELMKGDKRDPGVKKVEALYRYFAKSDLRL